MKRQLVTALLLLAVQAGAYATRPASDYTDDLYEVHDRTRIAARKAAQAQAQAQAEQARKAAWDSALAEAKAAAIANGTYYSEPAQGVNPYDAVLADTYESAYARRMYGFSSPTYRLPSSYYNMRYSDAYQYASAYDPAFYNVMVSGDQVWVEPKYITSMFGAWGATAVYPSYNWYYGWIPVYSYAWWGYPRYGWYDPWYGYGYCYPYHYYHHHHYRPPYHGGGYRPDHRPPHGNGGIVHRPPQNGNRPSYGAPGSGSGSGSTYYRPSIQSGTSSGNRNNEVRRGGTSTGSGVYRGSSGTTNRGSGSSSGTYRPSSSSSSRSSSYSSGSSSSYNRSSSGGGGNYSGGSHGGGQRRR